MRYQIVAAILALAVVGPGGARATSAQSIDARQGELVPIWLPRPEYPPIARSARVQGDVEVAAEVDAAGHVVTATMRSGHALFRAAAFEAARETHFAGRPPGAELSSYSLGYTFALGDSGRPPRPPFTVTSTGAHLTTVTGVDLVSCGPSPLGVRGPKCLYLWRCGLDWDWWRTR
jgi:TonB family protein